MSLRNGLLVLAVVLYGLAPSRAEANLPDAMMCTADEMGLCNGIDDDCNGLTDDNSCVDGRTCAFDQSTQMFGCLQTCNVSMDCVMGLCVNHVCQGPIATSDGGNTMVDATTIRDVSTVADSSGTVEAGRTDANGGSTDSGTVMSDVPLPFDAISDVDAAQPCVRDTDCLPFICACGACDPTQITCVSNQQACGLACEMSCPQLDTVGCLCAAGFCQRNDAVDAGEPDVVEPDDVVTSSDVVTSDDVVSSQDVTTSADGAPGADSGVVADATSGTDSGEIDPNNSGPSFRGGACKCRVAVGAGAGDTHGGTAFGLLAGLAVAITARRRGRGRRSRGARRADVK